MDIPEFLAACASADVDEAPGDAQDEGMVRDGAFYDQAEHKAGVSERGRRW